MGLYVPSEYSNYKYLVSASDNYVCLSSRRYINGSWQQEDEIPVIYQYLKPSFLTIEDTLSATYYKEFESVDLTSDFQYRADYIDIMCGVSLLCILVIFIFKNIIKIAYRF